MPELVIDAYRTVGERFTRMQENKGISMTFWFSWNFWYLLSRSKRDRAEGGEGINQDGSKDHDFQPNESSPDRHKYCDRQILQILCGMADTATWSYSIEGRWFH